MRSTSPVKLANLLRPSTCTVTHKAYTWTILQGCVRNRYGFSKVRIPALRSTEGGVVASRPGSQDLDDFATRLGWLFDNVPGPTGQRWALEAFARECTLRGTALSSSSIRHYLQGRRASPPARTLFEIAGIFDVDPRFFWDESYTQRIKGEIIETARRFS